MYCASDLRKMTIQQLTPIAREYGVTRMHSMKKAELVEKLLQKLKDANMLAPDKEELPASTSGPEPLPPVPEPFSEQDAQLMRAFTERASSSLKKTESSMAKVAAAQNHMSQANELAYLPDAQSDITEDSFVLDMVDPFWLHVTWCIRRKTMERAKTGLGQYWYTARPMLRVTVINDGDSGTGGRFRHLRDMFIHGHVNHWFIPVSSPPATYVAELGFYCTVQKKFYALLKSNVISTPQVRSALRYEKSAEVAWMSVTGLQPAKVPSWSPKNHNLYKKWSEKVNKTLASDSSTIKVETPEAERQEYPLRVSTELVIYGSTTPDDQVTVNSEWVAVQPDGTFMMRIEVPEQGRQVMTIESKGHGRVQTMVMSLERTTQAAVSQQEE
ncbi:MAG: DUF4912 domain-containing protein [Planctomycetia bacterium]|nr:DUF4912 domain-containing protein [Planctomycetia bacterium]